MLPRFESHCARRSAAQTPPDSDGGLRVGVSELAPGGRRRVRVVRPRAAHGAMGRRAGTVTPGLGLAVIQDPLAVNRDGQGVPGPP